MRRRIAKVLAAGLQIRFGLGSKAMAVYNKLVFSGVWCFLEVFKCFFIYWFCSVVGLSVFFVFSKNIALFC